jgi:hypothetical protein
MKSNIPEEESLTPIIRDIEKLFQKLFKGFSNLLKNLGLLIGKLFYSWKKLAMISFLGGIIGASTLLFIPREYASDVVLKAHIDAKDQLFSDVENLNALIESNKLDKLSEILGISIEEAKTIKSFEISSAATITERLSHLDKVFSQLDSNLKKNIVVEDLLIDEEYTFSNKFKFTIYSTDPFVFEGMEETLIAFFERVPELNRLRQNKLDIIQMQKKLYLSEIQGLDSLKIILNNVMLEQAKAKESSEMTINMGQSNQSDLINPLSVYAQVSDYTQRIANLNEQIPLYEKCYFVVSHLNDTGQKSGFGGLLRTLLGVVIFGLLSALIILFTPLSRQ